MSDKPNTTNDLNHFTRIALLIAVLLLIVVGLIMPTMPQPVADEVGEAIVGIAVALAIYPRVANALMQKMMQWHSRGR